MWLSPPSQAPSPPPSSLTNRETGICRAVVSAEPSWLIQEAVTLKIDPVRGNKYAHFQGAPTESWLVISIRPWQDWRRNFQGPVQNAHEGVSVQKWLRIARQSMNPGWVFLRGTPCVGACRLRACEVGPGPEARGQMSSPSSVYWSALEMACHKYW